MGKEHVVPGGLAGCPKPDPSPHEMAPPCKTVGGGRGRGLGVLRADPADQGTGREGLAGNVVLKPHPAPRSHSQRSPTPPPQERPGAWEPEHNW